MSRADRIVLSAAAGLFLVLAVAVFLTSSVSEEQTSPIPSSYAGNPGGARAAYLLLQRLGVRIERLEEPPLRLDGQNATLILAEPLLAPSHLERAGLRRFVENGGRVLFCGSNRRAFFPWVKLDKLPSQSADIAVIGRGELVWWPDAKPLTNAALQQDRNLALFLNSAGFESRKTVYWDEYFHGERRSLWDYVGRVAAVRWALLPLCVLLIAALLTFSRRSGPLVVPARVSRLSPLEFVDSLGALYRKAKASSLAVEVTAHELRLQLLRRLALPSKTPDPDLARAAATRLRLDERELLKTLEQARAAAQTRSLSPSQAVAIVQSSQRFTALLARAASERND